MNDRKYIVLEIQTNADGTVAMLTDSFPTIEAAYNKYYTVLAYAAISTLPRHSACLIDNTGFLQESKYFEHPLLEEE